MKQCLLYGNCQTAALRTYLEKNLDFTSLYGFIDLKPVHLLSEADVPYLNEAISKTDLLIHQPVSDSYKGVYQLSTCYLKSQLKPGSKVISFPVAYFTGYNPELFYFKDNLGNVVSEPFPYHDANILRHYMEGKSIQDTIRISSDEDYYEEGYVSSNLEKTLKNLLIREEKLDIKLSEFIQDNFRKVRLFHVFNHPSSFTLSFLYFSILKILGLSDTLSQLKDKFGSPTYPLQMDVLARNSYPIYKSLSKCLDINFQNPVKYRFNNQDFSVDESITRFFEFYDKNEKLLQKNVSGASA